MSILTQAYALCTALQDTPARAHVQDTFYRATRPSSDSMFTGNDKSMLEYNARDLGTQFLSYLLTSQEREPFLKRNNLEPASAGAYPPMDNEHVAVFENAHRAILDLNLRCIAPLLSVLPATRKAANPFSSLLAYRFLFPPQLIDLFPEKEVEALVTSFTSHPALDIALETGKRMDSSMSEDDYLQAVLQMRTSILEAGALAAPQGLRNIERQLNKASNDRMLFRHIAAILCISASLRGLNQHIFQAIIQDKPLVITEDELIDNGFPATNHLVGTGRTVLYQVPDDHPMIEIYDHILIKAPTIKIDELCEVASWKRTFRYGHTLELEVRVVDSNLNPYGSLLERI